MLRLTTPLFFSVLLLAACGDGDDGTGTETAATDNAAPAEAGTYEEAEGIAEVIGTDERFSILTAAVEAAGLDDELEEGGTYTLFAPTDTAFAQLPDGAVEALMDPDNRETLDDLLRYHLVAERRIAVDTGPGAAETLSGRSLALERFGGRLRVGGAEGAVVTDPGIDAANGVVHGIDRVLLPPSAD